MGNSLKTFISRVNHELKVRGIKASELAGKADLFDSQLSLYLNGEKKPSLEIMDRISKALEFEAWELMKPQGAVEKTPPTVEALLEKISEQQKRIRELEAELAKIDDDIINEAENLLSESDETPKTARKRKRS